MIANLFRKLKAKFTGTAEPAPVPASSGIDIPSIDVDECLRKLTALSDALDPALASSDLQNVKVRCNDLEQFLERLSFYSELPAIRRIQGAGYFDLGTAFRQVRQVQEAEMAYNKAINVLQSIAHIDEHKGFALSQLAACKNHLGLLFMICGPQDKAILALDDAIRQRKALADIQPGDYWNLVYLGGALCNRAHIARERGENLDAMRLYDEAIELLWAVAPDAHCEQSQAMLGALSAAFPGLPAVAHQFRVNAQDGKRLLPELY